MHPSGIYRSRLLYLHSCQNNMLPLKTISRSSLTSPMKFRSISIAASLGFFATSTSGFSTSTPPPVSMSTEAAPITASNICGARKLGSSDLIVSEACLGTMTFGVQNDAKDAFAQLDYARYTKGCNFIDTAELYPVPLTAPDWRAGATEEIIGEYIQKVGPSERDEMVIGSKIAGYFPNSPIAAARFEPQKHPAPDCRLDAKSVREACDASLRRLKTDRIDLMQIHWPDRYVPSFGLMNYQHAQKRDDAVPIRETAQALKDLIDQGKIRYIGLSNESTACDELGIRDKLATIQNSYSLLDRRFDTELAEACDHYNIGLLPWSVLAGGLLSGKYRTDANKNGLPSSTISRFNKYPEYMKRWSPKTASAATLAATDEYAKIAEDYGMTPAQLAIGFIRSRKFVADNGSVIVGATTLEQLKENLTPFDGNPVDLDEDILKRIDEVHLKCRDPSCAL